MEGDAMMSCVSWIWIGGDVVPCQNEKRGGKYGMAMQCNAMYCRFEKNNGKENVYVRLRFQSTCFFV
jgi:hypothetical protein